MVLQEWRTRFTGWAATALLLAAAPGARAELPPLGLTLVKDLNTAPAPRSSSPDAFLSADGKAYFAASTPAMGRELYVSDGSEAGTRLLADVLPGKDSSDPLVIGVVGGHVILRAGTTPPARQFWSVPTGGGTPRQLTAESWTGDYTVPSPRVLATTGSRLLFRIVDESGVWSTDGSAAGTARLVAASGFPVPNTLAACSMDGFALLAGRTDSSQLQLARTDGTIAGTQTLATLPPSGHVVAVRAAGHCYLMLNKSGGGWSLWASDGTPAGTAELSVNNAASAFTLVATGDAVYFSDRNVTQDRVRVLRSSVAAPQPQVVKEFIGSGHRIDAIQTVGDALLFFHGVGSNATDTLYLSDGTSAGTRSVFPLEPGQSFRTTSLYPVPGGVVFNAWDELKRLDLATGAVTQGPDSAVVSMEDSVLVGGMRLGRGRDEQTGDELWRSDGTHAGSSRVTDIFAATADGIVADGSPQQAGSALLGDVLVFTGASDPTAELPLRTAIWRSDGTAAGTYALPRSAYDDGSTGAVARLGDGVIFSTGGWSHVPYEVYRTDAALGTATLLAGGITAPVNMQPSADSDAVLFGCDGSLPATTLCRVAVDGVVTAAGPSGVDFTRFRPVGEVGGITLLQRAEAGEIWRSDGSVPGTFPLGLQSSYGPIPSAVFGGSLYFVACDDAGCALAASDGSIAGTRIVFRFQDAELHAMAALADRVVFSLQYAGRVELWASDGSAGGTQRLIETAGFRSTPIAVAGGNAHLAAFSTLDAGGGYIVSDGTVAGTRQPPLPASFAAYDTTMAALGDVAVVFGCYSPASSGELCVADAQGMNARALPETSPGATGLPPAVIRSTANGAYILADDGVHGRELWYLRRLPDALFADGFQAVVESDR